MLIPIPLTPSSKFKSSGEQNLNSKLKSQQFVSSSHPYSFPRKKYRDHAFSHQPQPHELDIYLGWKTSDVISEMRDLGYNVSLNIPQSVMSFDLGFGRLYFYFDREKSTIHAVNFQPDIKTA